MGILYGRIDKSHEKTHKLIYTFQKLLLFILFLINLYINISPVLTLLTKRVLVILNRNSGFNISLFLTKI